MTSAKDIPVEQVRSWVKAESAKGRDMRDIVKELSTRDDVTLLSVQDSPEVRHQTIIDSAANHKAHQ